MGLGLGIGLGLGLGIGLGLWLGLGLGLGLGLALLEQPLLELLLGREALGVGVDQRREVREEEVPARGDATRAWARGGDTAEAGSEAGSEAGCMAPLRRVPA